MAREGHYGSLEMKDTENGKHFWFRVIETIIIVITFKADMPDILSGALASYPTLFLLYSNPPRHISVFIL